MAQANLRTIIIDADVRRPSLHKIFRVPNKEGVTDLLRSSNLEINDYIKETGVENLRIITSGPLPPNSAEMIGSERMVDFIKRLRDIADVVLFDSSPVLAVTDASVLSSRVDGVILVTQAKRTRRDSVKQSLRRLNQVGANVMGCVLNQAPHAESSYSHSEYYTRGSGDTRPGVKRRGWKRFLPFLDNLKAGREV
jgi:capsular exopolysaccharide synthesis family protein